MRHVMAQKSDEVRKRVRHNSGLKVKQAHSLDQRPRYHTLYITR